VTALRALAVLAATVALSACEPGVEGSYKPPFVPISVSVNEKGELSVRYEGSIVTPIGTFSLNITPPVDLHEDDTLLEFLHDRVGEPVKSLFVVHDLGKSEAEMVVNDGTDVNTSGDQSKTTIEVPPGAQEFTVEVDDEAEVAEPSTTSVTSWSEPPPTTTTPSDSVSPTPSTTDSSDSSTPPDSIPATLPEVEVVPTS
jgi:hypothetical protein